MKTVEELHQDLENIPISVGGYAVLKDNDIDKYYFIEQPVKGQWIINKDFWYTFTKIDINKLELITYR